MKTVQTTGVKLKLLAALLAASTVTHQAAEVEVLLPSPDYYPSGTGSPVLIDPFRSDPAPGVFVGTIHSSAGLLRVTPNDSLSTTYNVETIDNVLTAYRQIACNKVDQVLYAAGQGLKDPRARKTVEVWMVRKSADQGTQGTWSPDDTYFLGKGATSFASGMTVDESGNVFAAGVASDGRSPYLTVRRKAGGSWANVYQAKGSNIDMRPAMLAFPGVPSRGLEPAVFVVSELNSRWTVLRSKRNGESGSWDVVDSWANVEASAYDIACDPVTGRIYVVGCRGLNGKNPSGWVVRSSDLGGDKNSWIPLLDEPRSGSWAARLAVDSTGAVSVSGVARDPDSQPMWAFVRCTEPGSTAAWKGSYQSMLLPYGRTSSKGYGVAADSSGNLFVTGELESWTESTGDSTITYTGWPVGLIRIVLNP